jgi:actin related protein 2/3 complex subunit 1A/1B
MVAIAPNCNDVHIMAWNGKTFTKIAELKEHESRVTGVDWGKTTNQIVTCSEDRNAYVWKLDAKGVWEPTLVILRINRAATSVKWSPKEDKFAVGSGSRLVSICYYEEENNWWVSKHLKKPIRSTVTCIDWHPNNVIVAVGSTDYRCRVFGTYIKEVDVPVKQLAPTCWGKKLKFGELLGDYGVGTGWVHSVSFDETGDKVAFVGHDSTITVVDKSTGAPEAVVKTPYLPFRCCTWITPDSVVAAGHNNIPYVYEYHSGDSVLVETGSLDVPAKKESTKRISAMDKFRSMDSKGTADVAKTSAVLETVHQNSINEIEIFEGDKGAASKLSTVGVDGKLVFWDLAKLATSIPMTIK